MKRLALLICLVVVITVTGCEVHDSAMEKGLALRDRILNASGCAFRTEITADYGNAIHTFSMDIQADNQGSITFSVSAPESIEGITGSISQSESALTFDNTALAFPLLADGQLSPVSAPWIFLKTLRSGYITSVCTEDSFLHITIDDSYADDALTLDIWVNEEIVPVHAQILYKGRSILTLSVENFQLL